MKFSFHHSRVTIDDGTWSPSDIFAILGLSKALDDSADALLMRVCFHWHGQRAEVNPQHRHMMPITPARVPCMRVIWLSRNDSMLVNR